MVSVIDLRSDTVTRPTAAMRAAMAAAEVGDDVYGEDPTVNQLEAEAAARVGKAAGLLMPSGTMGNLLAIMAHTQPGDQMIMGRYSHIYRYEQGSSVRVAGVFPAPIDEAPDGRLPLDAIADNIIATDDPHRVNTRLIALENTHNARGGRVLPIEYLYAVQELARRNDLKLHLDGARVFNAAVALGVPVAEVCAPVDSVTFCLSKGLGAPVGSVLCGDADFIQRARRYRKLLGGGMRQAGVLAAAGLVALNEMVERLADDHVNATRLAEGLRGLPGITIASVETNMVYFDLMPDNGLTPAQLADELKAHNVLISAGYPTRSRLVTHADVSHEMIAAAVAAFAAVLGG